MYLNKLNKSTRRKVITIVYLLAFGLTFGSCKYMEETDAPKYDSIPRNKIEVVVPETIEREVPVAEEREGEDEPVIIPSPVQTSEEDYEWEDVFGKAGITRYLGEETAIILPDNIGGLPVGVICEYAFTGKPLTVVYMPETVVEIQTEAFFSCDKLLSVRMNGVQHIGDRAFAGCVNLSSIRIPWTIKGIGNMAFASCGKMKEADLINSQLEVLGKGAFIFSGIKKATFPKTLKEIQEQTCYHCDRLKEVTISEGTETIGSLAFGGCHKLTKVEIPKSVETFNENSFCDVPSVVIMKEEGPAWKSLFKSKEKAGGMKT